MLAIDDAPGNAAAFRELFRNVPSPVVVVTASENGIPHATTVSSFCSLSIDPLLALVVLDNNSAVLGIIERTRRVGINLLNERQHWIGAACATKTQDKFDAVEWRADDGLPRILDTAGWLSCDVAQITPAGDHKMVVASPRRIKAADVRPLVYHLRQFCYVGPAAA
jgi:flavin reductase (DIM6/NTAB) family NADH-FMN oxidoreductase RutF